MNRKHQFVAILLPAVLILGLPERSPSQEVRNIKPGKTYSSPLKDFKVPAPELCLGTKIQQEHDRNGGMVAFLSDVGQLERIDFERLDPSAVSALARADAAEKLAMYTEHLNSSVIRPNEATLLVEGPFELEEMEALFAVAEFPGGGVLEKAEFRDGKMVLERVDSVRGLMVFSRGDIIYVLHHEVGTDFEQIWSCGLEGQGGSGLTEEERNRVAREGLANLHASLRFE